MKQRRHLEQVKYISVIIHRKRIRWTLKLLVYLLLESQWGWLILSKSNDKIMLVIWFCDWGPKTYYRIGYLLYISFWKLNAKKCKWVDILSVFQWNWVDLPCVCIKMCLGNLTKEDKHLIYFCEFPFFYTASIHITPNISEDLPIAGWELVASFPDAPN